MSKHRFLAGGEIRWKAPKIRIMLKHDDMITDHMNAVQMEVYGMFGLKLDTLPLFVPSGDRYPDSMRSMMYHDRSLIEMFPHSFSTREPWDPMRGQTCLLYDRKGMKLPFAWVVEDYTRHDEDSDHGMWIWLRRGPEPQRS